MGIPQLLVTLMELLAHHLLMEVLPRVVVRTVFRVLLQLTEILQQHDFLMVQAAQLQPTEVLRQLDVQMGC